MKMALDFGPFSLSLATSMMSHEKDKKRRNVKKKKKKIVTKVFISISAELENNRGSCVCVECCQDRVNEG